MFDIGWTELLLIGIVALIVIGPKDLPEMFRTLGRFTAKARGMAREFQRAMESAADEAGVKDIAKDLKETASARGMGLDTVKDAAKKFENWDPLKATKAAAKDAVKTAVTPIAEKGPATQALADAQAAKRAALAETATGAAPVPKAARKVATPKPAAAEAAKKPAAKSEAKKPAAKKPAPNKPTATKGDA